MTASHMLLLVPFALALLLSKPAESAGVCQRPRPWTVNGMDPMAQARADKQIVVLALMEARACGICVRQAKAMESLLTMLRQRERSYQLGNLYFMIVNHHMAAGSIRFIEERVSFPVYQENANKQIWPAVDGAKDDIIVYDRCGGLVSHLKWPKSDLTKPHLWQAIHRAKWSKACCKQQTTEPPTISDGGKVEP
ncbi:selenoprotein P [Nematostella vectensis]|uniref:selenoprotein P n=1 Tax=Nematostella vectensis TaxID=45351 RepID=UPI0020773844|nr:selenoprotein P [Nematostella vectensis]